MIERGLLIACITFSQQGSALIFALQIILHNIDIIKKFNWQIVINSKFGNA